MGLSTQDLCIQKEHNELYKILKVLVNWANIEQDTAIQKLQNLLRNMDFRTSVWQSVHLLVNVKVFEWLYLLEYWPN